MGKRKRKMVPVKIECYAKINPGEIRFGRSVEEKLFKKKKG